MKAPLAEYITPDGFILQAEVGSEAEKNFLERGCVRRDNLSANAGQLAATVLANLEKFKELGLPQETIDKLKADMEKTNGEKAVADLITQQPVEETITPRKRSKVKAPEPEPEPEPEVDLTPPPSHEDDFEIDLEGL